MVQRDLTPPSEYTLSILPKVLYVELRAPVSVEITLKYTTTGQGPLVCDDIVKVTGITLMLRAPDTATPCDGESLLSVDDGVRDVDDGDECLPPVLGDDDLLRLTAEVPTDGVTGTFSWQVTAGTSRIDLMRFDAQGTLQAQGDVLPDTTTPSATDNVYVYGMDHSPGPNDVSVQATFRPSGTSVCCQAEEQITVVELRLVNDLDRLEPQLVRFQQNDPDEFDIDTAWCFVLRVRDAKRPAAQFGVDLKTSSGTHSVVMFPTTAGLFESDPLAILPWNFSGSASATAFVHHPDETVVVSYEFNGNGKKKKKPKIVIVVDPGHGGVDPGAVGPTGLTEKSVNLAIAQKLKAKLDADPNIEFDVRMTRTGDETKSVVNRSDFTKANDPDLFISIHQNAATPTAKGTETYTTSRGPFARETDLAQRVQNKVHAFVSRHNRGVKTADYHVIRHTENDRTNGILIEATFLSNPTDEAKLKQDPYLDGIAEAIKNGIVEAVKP